MIHRYQIELPEELKHILANDWDLVVHQRHLFRVPAKVTHGLGCHLLQTP